MELLSRFFSQLNLEILMNGLGLFAVIIAGVLAVMLAHKAEQVRTLRRTITQLQRSFNDLDEQAKLIVKTDLELNRTQEQLDKRLSALNALQKASQLISTTLDAAEIFRRLDRALVADLGFEKSILLMLDDAKAFQCRIQSGFSEKQIERVLAGLATDRTLNAIAREGRIVSTLSAPKQKKERLQLLLDMDHFILCPILSQEGLVGILIVGNQAADAAITDGDEELLSILSNQIGQSLENAQLFEQVYHSQQDLEIKIQDRTKQLTTALNEVQQINRAKSEFVSAVSHELRTPLTSIKGYASILISGKIGEVPDKVKERLTKINQHSDSLVQLINDLLDIARIESGRVEMTFKACDLAKLIDGVGDLLTPQMKEKNIAFVTDIADGLPAPVIDTSHVERVFINLISNAIKFTPPNGTITVSAHPHENNTVLIDVTDTGIGITEKDIEKLFNEFYRVENEINQTVKGTGLGLTLVKNIIEAHHGTIWVTSAPNKGTAVHFTLPAARQDNA